MSPAILIVEDDAGFARTLAAGLREEAMQVFLADSVGAAERVISEKTLDIILLDLGLPGREGCDVLDFLHATGRMIPVIIVSARADVDERIHALGLGADDYLVKPFSFAELVARIRALLRRTQSSEQTLTSGPIRIDLMQRRVTCCDEPVELSPREFDLLAFLARHAECPVSRDTLARDVLRVRSRATPVDNVIEVNISRLRSKLARAGKDVIQTVRGIGYQFSAKS
jgi:DNA-binding response OmpR family regulator